MKKVLITLIFLATIPYRQLEAQQLYFPPATGTAWDTLSPARLGWCPSRIDSLYDYLQKTKTRAFIVLYQGKIVLEKYFNGHTSDSLWYWASAGKTITAFLIGMAQQNGSVQLGDRVSAYLGNGWTSAPPAKENLITVGHLLTMTSGLNDNPQPPCDGLSKLKACLQYLADAGTRWGYHTGAYYKLHDVLQAISGQGITAYTRAQIGDRIGMNGFWVNGVFISNARSMARFGLLNLARGRWGADTLLKDTTFFRQMTTTSQPFNQSYGYLWWLNGQASYMVPGLQLVFRQPLVPNGPPDMFAALGMNDQKIYVVPSREMVVIRMGNSAYDQSAALSKYDDTLWQKINALPAGPGCTYTFTGSDVFSNGLLWRHTVPPPQALPAGQQVIIEGNCILNQRFELLPQSILRLGEGSILTVSSFQPPSP
jgi:CubicO group peptidase (beta-lactamase class C family)